MAYTQQESVKARLQDLCVRSQKTNSAVCTRFLSPPEAALAQRVALEHGLLCALCGGYEGAERVMACIYQEGEEPVFPLCCVQITWDKRYGHAEHRALLGSVLGLGIEREMVGDICLTEGKAYLMTVQDMADFIAEGLVKAGGTPVAAAVMTSLPDILPSEGKMLRDTVASLRLDAVLAAGLNLSRSDAANCILSGRTMVNHMPETRLDAKVQEGDLLSIRGHGRLKLTAVGTPNRKGRIPIQFESHGIH